MLSLVFAEPNRMALQATPEPKLDAGDVLIRVDAVGICGSDLHAFRGHDPRRVPPMTLGHEFVGTAESGPAAGQRFTANPLIVCGQCRYCTEGRTNLCSDRTMIGMSRPGAFAERLAVPAQALIAVPATVSDRAAALTEPAATVVHALHLGERALTRPLGEARVLVIGAGAIGLLGVLLLRHRGVTPVVVEPNPLRAEALTRATGIEATPADRVESGFDLVFDAVGIDATRTLSIASAAPGSVVVHAGLGDWTSPLDWRSLTLREITLIGCYTYSTADLRAALSLLGQGAFGSLDWVEERPLSAGAEAFTDLVAGRVASPKVLLRP